METIPTFMYGTAWKEDATAGLVGQALEAGFTAIDTANQRKHYHEAGVGEALQAAFAKGLRRESIFLQTKFTSLGGQDQRLPYDAAASPAEQVRQSFESSLAHLHTDYLDSYVLHGPSRRQGLAPEDWEVWGAMEALQKAGRTRRIGASNVSAAQLAELCAKAVVKPAMVQNRCFAVLGWDREVRSICRAQGIVYQGFSLLTANQDVFDDPGLRAIASRAGAGPAQVVFRFAQQVGMLPLTGTTDPVHMKEDLDIARFTLPDQDLKRIESIAL